MSTPIDNGGPSVLLEAQRLVHGDRQAAYGHPFDDYTRTGRIWGAMLGIPDIDPRLCCLMMAAVKISRECNAPKRDNRVDGAGYFECADMVARRQEELAEKCKAPQAGPGLVGVAGSFGEQAAADWHPVFK